ncbi:hypothetical protein Pla175_09300 [Pirellulimonas nuda]|uniref:DNA mimic protein DMP19 C-terminal domain-containing protein n=2 Tax=Pirellulimonas nuda TaxID=2528009 RepID=A0A518D7Y2_9BACT|nr:hypothetical protein Pla175_09300 [Pirellulimonas nuda]
MNWDELWDKYREVDYEGLKQPEQVWLNTRAFIDSVNNGGLISFFYNSGADLYDDTVFALGELKAFEALEALESFGKLFGDDVPFDIDERNRIISAWEDNGPEVKACENVDKVLYPLFPKLEETLEAYLIEHGLDPDYGF